MRVSSWHHKKTEKIFDRLYNLGAINSLTFLVCIPYCLVAATGKIIYSCNVGLGFLSFFLVLCTNDAEEKVWLVRRSQIQHSCLQCIDGDDDDAGVAVVVKVKAMNGML